MWPRTEGQYVPDPHTLMEKQKKGERYVSTLRTCAGCTGVKEFTLAFGTDPNFKARTPGRRANTRPAREQRGTEQCQSHTHAHVQKERKEGSQQNNNQEDVRTGRLPWSLI